MKYITHILRLLVGLLFIFSGFIKLNDPKGFSYKLEEYFSVFSQDLSVQQDSFFTRFTLGEQVIEHGFQLLPSQEKITYQLSHSGWEQVYDSSTQTSFNRAEVFVFAGDESLGSLMVVNSDSSDVSIQMEQKAGTNDAVKESITVKAQGDFSHLSEKDAKPFVKAESWMSGFFESLKPYALAIGIFICVFEVILGWALLIGWQTTLVLWLLFLMIVFFTFLTGYSAIFNKVTDCGCFGNAIPLTPWESFYKDIILTAAILLLVLGRKYIKPMFSAPFSAQFLVVMAVIFSAFSLLCLEFLPLFNFLQYKKGNDIAALMQIPEGERVSPHKVMEYIYSDGQKEIVVQYDSDKNTFIPNINPEWTFVRVGEEKVLEEAYEPPIHDFHLYLSDGSTDHVDSFLNQKGYKILLVMHQLGDAHISAMKKVKVLAEEAEKEGIPFWALTASAAEAAEAFRHEHQLPVEFHFGDDTNLKSIIRSNPGILLFKDNVVVEDWSSRRIPSIKKIRSNMK